MVHDAVMQFDAVTRRWTPLPNIVNATFTVPNVPLTDDVRTLLLGDQGDDDPVTQVVPELNLDEVRDAASAAPTDEPRPETPPFRLTRAVLQELGACGTYVRKFSNTFPTERYPNGIEINEQTCGNHHQVFDWEWAINNMLNGAGRDAYTLLVRSRVAENKRFGTGNERRARVFGHIFATRPDLRHEDIEGVHERALTIEDTRVLRDLERAKINIQHFEIQLKQIGQALEQERARLPELEEAAAGAKLRQAHRKKREAEQTLQRMTERLQNARSAVEQATAEITRLAQVVQEVEAKKQAETVEVPNDASALVTSGNNDDTWSPF